MAAAQPRPYQIELLNEAQRSNIIAFLDTGSGKTLISILLMEQMAAKLVPIDRDEVAKKLSDKLIQRLHSHIWDSSSSSTKENHLLVPTVSLVTQQAEKIRQATELVVGEYSREDSASVSYWDALGWAVEMSHKQVLVFTPQIFLNTLRHGFMVNQYSLKRGLF
ncbi:hypothetical protein BCR33DRAFT_845461 [Rhizoclosmatium globosum]|uniref:Helicase ATP-binding domain-containing protein n=1 Tax=Rhizoclosmatium globosum TaxID=329046 RepID=A0A1Y2D1W7_9FUNG|nr:hypothetical protein BCR33DRAFT_845461 [Rhizoclosmatium globosum]|eukprot:ORY53278.1 hypothetical protein BCR33DRAFT_845461 [Rhizoclosmatium globosum]